MAVFRYKMQGILDIKEKLEDKAKQEFAEANMRLEAEKQKLSELQKRRDYYMMEGVKLRMELIDVRKIRENKMDQAMGLVEKMPPLYTRFIDLEPPEVYAEAHELISSGAVSSGEVLRLTAAIAEAAKDESNLEKALALQEELESHTAQAQNFSKGLRMVLGDQVGVGEDAN